MAECLRVLRRTSTEKRIFGGEVYIDIDGKNVGILGEKDFNIELEIEKHILKMYKSHTMGSFIGIAESEFSISDGEKLFARYSAPLMVNQSGTIIISKYESDSQLDKLSSKIESELNSDFKQSEEQKLKQEEESKNNNSALIFWIIIVPTIIGLLILRSAKSVLIPYISVAA